MPTILYEDGFSFIFFASDGGEAPHVHVRKGGGNAKWWLSPIREAWSRDFKPPQRAAIRRIIAEYQGFLLDEWKRFFSQN